MLEIRLKFALTLGASRAVMILCDSASIMAHFLSFCHR